MYMDGFLGWTKRNPTGWFVRGSGIPGRGYVSMVLRRRNRTQHSSLGTWMTVPKGSGGKTTLLPKSQLGCRCGEGTDGRSPQAELAPPLVPGFAAGAALSFLWGEVLSKQRKPREDATWPLLPGPAGQG